MTCGVFAVKIFEVGEDEASAISIQTWSQVAKREIDQRINGHLAVAVSTPSHQIADTRAERAAASERGALRSLVLSASHTERCRQLGQHERPPRCLLRTSGGGGSVTCTTGSRTSWWR